MATDWILARRRRIRVCGSIHRDCDWNCADLAGIIVHQAVISRLRRPFNMTEDNRYERERYNQISVGVRVWIVILAAFFGFGWWFFTA